MKGTCRKRLNLFPQRTQAVCMGDNLRSPATNRQILCPHSEAKGQPLTIFKLCYVQWNGKTVGRWQAGRIRQSIPLAALLGRAIWDENRCVPRDYVVEHLDDGILAVDEPAS